MTPNLLLLLQAFIVRSQSTMLHLRDREQGCKADEKLLQAFIVRSQFTMLHLRDREQGCKADEKTY